MSTEANIAFVQKAYADYRAGNIKAIMDTLADDIEWIMPGKSLPSSGTFHGKAGVARFLEITKETWSSLSLEPRQYIASGDTVAVVGTVSATARSTGRSLTTDWVMLWKIRDGKLASFQEMTDTLAAAEALKPHAATA